VGIGERLEIEHKGGDGRWEGRGGQVVAGGESIQCSVFGMQWAPRAATDF